MKNNHTRQPGAQNPHPGPLPTGPYNIKYYIIITLNILQLVSKLLTVLNR